MPGIRHIVSFGAEPAIVDEEIVDLVRTRLDGVEQVAYRDFDKGDRVRIKSGPLSELEAVFDQPLSSADRVRVLLDVMGRMTPVDIDGSDIMRL
jgi:transcription antitermination factor NusG